MQISVVYNLINKSVKVLNRWHRIMLRGMRWFLNEKFGWSLVFIYLKTFRHDWRVNGMVWDLRRNFSTMPVSTVISIILFKKNCKHLWNNFLRKQQTYGWNNLILWIFLDWGCCSIRKLVNIALLFVYVPYERYRKRIWGGGA